MLQIGEERKMSVQEVADVLGYEKDYLRKKVKELFPEIVRSGVETLLTERQVTDLKDVLAPRTLELKVQGQNAVTSIDIERMTIQVIQYHQNKVKELEEQLTEAQPKIDFFDAVTGSKDTIEIGEASKVLAIKGLGRNNLFEALRNHNVLMSNNQPYQKYIDAGYFRTIESTYTKSDGTTHITIKTVVYQKGLDFIRKVVGK
jgi:phage antirepressor YoqD-like protein